MGYYQVVEVKSKYETKYCVEYVYLDTYRYFTGWWPFRKWHDKEVVRKEPICHNQEVVYYDYAEQAIAEVKRRMDYKERIYAHKEHTVVWSNEDPAD